MLTLLPFVLPLLVYNMDRLALKIIHFIQIVIIELEICLLPMTILSEHTSLFL